MQRYRLTAIIGNVHPMIFRGTGSASRPLRPWTGAPADGSSATALRKSSRLRYIKISVGCYRAQAHCGRRSPPAPQSSETQPCAPHEPVEPRAVPARGRAGIRSEGMTRQYTDDLDATGADAQRRRAHHGRPQWRRVGVRDAVEPPRRRRPPAGAPDQQSEQRRRPGQRGVPARAAGAAGGQRPRRRVSALPVQHAAPHQHRQRPQLLHPRRPDRRRARPRHRPDRVRGRRPRRQRREQRGLAGLELAARQHQDPALASDHRRGDAGSDRPADRHNAQRRVLPRGAGEGATASGLPAAAPARRRHRGVPAGAPPLRRVRARRPLGPRPHRGASPPRHLRPVPGGAVRGLRHQPDDAARHRAGGARWPHRRRLRRRRQRRRQGRCGRLPAQHRTRPQEPGRGRGHRRGRRRGRHRRRLRHQGDRLQ